MKDARRSQSPRRQRRGSAAARLLGLRFRVPPGARTSVSCKCCVVFCQVEVSASGSSLVQRSPTECGVSEYAREVSIMRRPWPLGAVVPLGGGEGGGGDELLCQQRPRLSRLKLCKKKERNGLRRK
jgi:hypothetical protein